MKKFESYLTIPIFKKLQMVTILSPSLLVSAFKILDLWCTLKWWLVQNIILFDPQLNQKSQLDKL